jgi:hypothetical protein
LILREEQRLTAIEKRTIRRIIVMKKVAIIRVGRNLHNGALQSFYS